MPSRNFNSPEQNSSRKPYLVIFLLGCLSMLLLLYGKRTWSAHYAEPALAAKNREKDGQDFTINRVGGFNNTRPILSIDQVQESTVFSPIKDDLTLLIDSLKKAGIVSEASVYFREFEHGAWMGINQEARYHPASLMKVALLMCYLKIAEIDPSILKKQLLYHTPDSVRINPQFYAGQSIQKGKRYSIHELLYYMIAYSDNDATWLLASHFDNNRLKKLFADFDLPVPVEDDLRFVMTAGEYSVFFKAIYNSALLSPEFSEYAADLLSNCSFQEGFGKGFPKNTKMYHKFGEWRSAGHEHELHESGVFFINDQPYLLTVMTRGKDTPQLAQAISAIAEKVYRKIAPP
ncbi:MAG: serine hydrolase [Lewinellaceae bacterium]|nr:serine hydrolase [Lewinellaceae bacterium]